MKMYKPEYLGMVIPADNQVQLTDFVSNKYASFSKIYDICKPYSGNISDIKTVNNEESDDVTKLSVKINTDTNTIETIRQAIGEYNDIHINNNVITAMGSTL